METMQKTKRLFIKFFIGFMTLMLVFTIFSRVTRSLTVAVVGITKAKSGNIINYVRADGTMRSAQEISVSALKGAVVKQLHVKEGNAVKKGDLLLSLDRSPIEEEIYKNETELQRLELQYQQAGISDGSGSSDTQSKIERIKADAQSAEQDFEISLQRAEQDLSLSQENMERATSRLEIASERNLEKQYKAANEAYKAALKADEDLKYERDGAFADAQELVEDAKLAIEDIGKSTEVLADDKLSMAERDYYDALNEWDIETNKQYAELEAIRASLQHAREAAALDPTNTDYIKQIRELEQAYTTASLALTDLNAQRDKAIKQAEKNLKSAGTDKDINVTLTKEQANRELSKAMANVERVRSDYERRLKHSADEINKAKELLDKVERGELDEEQLATYQDTIYNLNSTLLERERAKEDVIRNNERKRLETDRQLADLRSNLQAEQQKNGAQEQRDAIQRSIIALDIEDKKRTIQKLKDEYAKGDEITAPSDAVVLAINADEGQQTGSQAVMSLTGGSFCLEAEIDEEDLKYLEMGDKAKVYMPAEYRPVETAKVTGIKRLTGDKSGKVLLTATLSKEEYEYGMNARLEIGKSSQKYQKLIPLNALRKDGDSDFVLVVEKQQTILGEELVAGKRPVTIIEKDSGYAAVSGLSDDENGIIISSNKPIVAGDIVRLMAP